MSNLKILLVLLVIFALGWLISLEFNPSPSNEDFALSLDGSNNISNELLVTLGENTVLVKSEEIVINEAFEESDVRELDIKKIDYPDLFDLEDKYSRIHVTEIKNSLENDNGLIYISNQRPNHGSINDGYFIKIDPKLKKVVDTGWNRLFGTVKIFSSCTSCSLPLMEYKRYDRATGEYTLVNVGNRNAFIKLRSELENINRKEICRINGVDYSLKKALDSAKDTDKCGDQGVGIATDEPASDFITIGQYREILKNIDRIINGENIKVFDRI